MTAALAGAVVAMIPLGTLAYVASAHAPTYWRHADLSDIGSTYRLLFGPLLGGILPLAAGLCALLVTAGITFGNRSSLRSEYPDVPPHEVAAVLVTVALPVGAVLLGIYGTGAYVSRYAIAAVIGVSILLPLVIARAGSRQRIADVVLCTALLATFCGSAYRSVAERTYRNPLSSRPMLLQALAQEGPIVVSGTTEYLQLWYYAPPDVRGRLVYLADPVAALADTGSDTIDRNYLALRRWSSVSVFDYDTFIAAHRTFRVYAPTRGWLVGRLEQSGAVFEEVGREIDGPIYRVTLPSRYDGVMLRAVAWPGP